MELRKIQKIDYKEIKTDFHIINLTDIYCPFDKPYIEILFSNTICIFVE